MAGMIHGVIFGPLPLLAQPQAQNVGNWNFESERLGTVPTGFRAVLGDWKTNDDGDNRILTQTPSDTNKPEPIRLILAPNLQGTDVDASVRLNARSGQKHQGGGIALRVQDANNFLGVSYYPHEKALRMFKVRNGAKEQIDYIRIVPTAGWHTLRVSMLGPKVVCFLDNQKLLEVELQQANAAQRGDVGLWVERDARTDFDDFSARVR